MRDSLWKVGALAKRTGLTVRALHHYDRMGLVTPSHSTEAGHRLYAQEDIGRLQQVISLKKLGFALEEIKVLLESGDYDPGEVLRLQMEKLRETIQQQEKLYERLEDLHARIRGRRQVSTEQFMKTIEVMNMDTNRYFTEEQMEKLRKRGESLGPERVREVEAEWPGLIMKVREKLDGGVPAGDPEVAALAQRWKELTDLFSGGDAGIVEAAERFHAKNPSNGIQNGMDGELYRYIKQAISLMQ